MLVRPEAERLGVYQAYIRARLLFDVFAFGALGSVLVVGAFLWTPFMGLVLLAGVGVVATAEGLAYSSTRRDLRRWGAKPGLYDNGVELPIFPLYAIRLFIPWEEMEDAWVRRSRALDDMLFISVRGSRWRWRVPSSLLGEDGVQEVLKRVKEPVPLELEEPRQEPPKLVIYSAAGAKTEVRPEDR